MPTALTSPFAFLDRSRIIAPPNYNRWLVPPAALAIHLCIGEAYAFSVFNPYLARLVGGDQPAAGDWAITEIGWVFSIAIVLLGLSAALFGSWLERVGPRKAMFASAACFGSGFLVSALGVWEHQLWLLHLGYGVLGGIGLGLGYISPVSTLIKWFPDRPGMATGLAIMGFGGGAMIGSPLSYVLLEYFGAQGSLVVSGPGAPFGSAPSPEHVGAQGSPGVAETFVVLGAVYFAFMMFGVLTVRLPPPGWKPPGAVKRIYSTVPGVTPSAAIRTRSFWLLWGVLLLNVTAGIGVLGQASLMIQEMFPNRVDRAAATGFVGLLSLFNMAGRFIWSSTSDVIGRKPTYMIFFALGAVLYALTPTTGHLGNVVLFVACYAVIMSMYGGGFATIPAYLRDQFGTAQVGAIHGRLLTAWSLAGVAGPVLVNYIREAQINSNVPKAEAYTVVMYLMAALLVVGFICNLLVRRAARPAEGPAGPATEPTPAAGTEPVPRAAAHVPALVFCWLWVGVPLAWGVSRTVISSLPLFGLS
jgi:MFS family permease